MSGGEKMRKLLCSFFVLTLALGLAPPGWGQSQISAGTVQGDVVDEKGGSVAGATVEAKNLATNFVQTDTTDRKSTRLNSSHSQISYAVFCLKKQNRFLQQPLPNEANHTQANRGPITPMPAGLAPIWVAQDARASLATPPHPTPCAPRRAPTR